LLLRPERGIQSGFGCAAAFRRIDSADDHRVLRVSHGFSTALRAGGVGEDVIDALTGHSTKGSVSRGYGAKDMVRRFGIERLVEAISASFDHLISTSSSRGLSGAISGTTDPGASLKPWRNE
jgi:hypothetical protein